MYGQGLIMCPSYTWSTLDIGGTYYYCDPQNQEHVTGSELIAMGHTTGSGGLIDPTGIHHYDGRLQDYVLKYNKNPDGSGIWAPPLPQM